MSKRVKPVKKRKRTDWRQCAENWRKYFEESSSRTAERKEMLFSASNELSKYRLICDWACQRIEKLEAVSSDWEASWLKAAHCCHEWVETALERSKEITKLQKERRILLDTLFEVQAENIMQAEDILRQRDELIKLRGVTGERVSCQR